MEEIVMIKFSRNQLESMSKEELILLVESLSTQLTTLDQEYTVLEDDYYDLLLDYKNMEEELEEFNQMLY